MANTYQTFESPNEIYTSSLVGTPVSTNTYNINKLDPRVRDVLDAWLKYGTVFLIFRICSFYFFDKNKNEKIFDVESLKLVISLLIGFTIYYLLVKPYIPVNLQHPILRNVANDTLMFGTVILSSHVIETYISNEEPFFRECWIKNAGLILLAFAAYRVVINPFIPYPHISYTARPVVDDLSQFGSFLIIFRLLQGKNLADQKWIASVLFALLGFTGYHFITRKIVNI